MLRSIAGTAQPQRNGGEVRDQQPPELRAGHEFTMAEETKEVAQAREIESDMKDALKAHVFEVARDAVGAHNIDKDIATSLKKKLDAHETYGGTWHCIVGKNFGCSVCHETECSVFFEIGGTYFLLFKSKD